VGELISKDLPVTYGVPQGSVLGPTLFLTYINELCDLQLSNVKVVSFADDTALIFHGDSWDDVYKDAQFGLNLATFWLKNHGLTLNVNNQNLFPSL
jgi:hypothetical protein